MLKIRLLQHIAYGETHQSYPRATTESHGQLGKHHNQPTDFHMEKHKAGQAAILLAAPKVYNRKTCKTVLVVVKRAVRTFERALGAEHA